MRCGLYGKLPSKRDFVAVGATREFLQVWEAWIQGGLSASRVQLGTAWQETFLRAPIWRFWLGQDICGTPLLGAFMPSVDGVGRYFPLTIFARPDAGESLPPPEIDRHEVWLAQAEDVLLSALAEGATFEAVGAAVESLAHAAGPSVPDPHPPRTLRGQTLIGDPAGGSIEAILSGFRRFDHGRVYAAMSYWWTLGGEGVAPNVLTSRRMPDPYLFAGMLAGRFDDASS